jgi:hypothetical protein
MRSQISVFCAKISVRKNCSSKMKCHFLAHFRKATIFNPSVVFKEDFPPLRMTPNTLLKSSLQMVRGKNLCFISHLCYLPPKDFLNVLQLGVISDFSALSESYFCTSLGSLVILRHVLHICLRLNSFGTSAVL